jgi:hypothetical protein
MKLIKLLAGIILLPFCVSLTMTLIDLMRSIAPASGADVHPGAWAFAAGFLLWLFIFFALPRPVRTYVLAHELSHALWGLLMGARVVNMNVAKRGGSVTLTRTNLLITLAPYFFPLYTAAVVGLYYLLMPFTDVARWHTVWIGLAGFTWSFHLSFTLSALGHQQSDVEEHGRVFSYAIIYSMNMLGICLWLVLVSHATLFQTLRFAARNSRMVLSTLAQWGTLAAHSAADVLKPG